jgi:hypothetical protein
MFVGVGVGVALPALVFATDDRCLCIHRTDSLSAPLSDTREAAPIIRRHAHPGIIQQLCGAPLASSPGWVVLSLGSEGAIAIWRLGPTDLQLHLTARIEPRTLYACFARLSPPTLQGGFFPPLTWHCVLGSPLATELALVQQILLVGPHLLLVGVQDRSTYLVSYEAPLCLSMALASPAVPLPPCPRPGSCPGSPTLLRTDSDLGRP